MTVSNAPPAIKHELKQPPRRARRRRTAKSATLAPDPAATAAVAPPASTTSLLNEALALEHACVSSYRTHHLIAQSLAKSASAERFLAYASCETEDSKSLAERIEELGAHPTSTLPPEDESIVLILEEPPSLETFVAADSAANRALIECFMRILTHVGESDLTTKFLVEDVLFNAQQRADEFQSWTER